MPAAVRAASNSSISCSERLAVTMALPAGRWSQGLMPACVSCRISSLKGSPCRLALTPPLGHKDEAQTRYCRLSAHTWHSFSQVKGPPFHPKDTWCKKDLHRPLHVRCARAREGRHLGFCPCHSDLPSCAMLTEFVQLLQCKGALGAPRFTDSFLALSLQVAGRRWLDPSCQGHLYHPGCP